MRKRGLFVVMAVVASCVLLAGCGNDPDKLFKKGEYAKAYPEFVKRGGTNEVALKQETTNGAFDTRNKAGNQAIHDFYYAAECQNKQGNQAEAKALYSRVVALSAYQIRIPKDKGAQVKDKMDALLRAIRELRSQEVSYGRDLREWENRPPTTGTDPYEGGNSNTDPYDNGNSNTDPYDNGNSNTDPYDNGNSNTDPYEGGNSNTDPYSGSSNSNTDPYNNVKYATDSAPSRYWLDNAYTTMRSRQREFERALYETTAAEMPAIASVKKEYDRLSRALDNYCMYAAPGGMLFKPDSIVSEMAYRSMQGNMDAFQRELYAAQTTVSYETYALSLKEPQLVTDAKAKLRALGGDPEAVLNAATGKAPEAVSRDSTGTTGTTGITVQSTGTTPFGQ